MNNKGFTLIELVVVIVVLGILATTVVPKYINLKADAQTSTLQGVGAAMEGASALIYGKSLVQANHKLPATDNPDVTVLNNITVALHYGYPTISANQWEKLLDVDLNVYGITNTIDSAVVVYLLENTAPLSFQQPCLTYYRSPNSEGDKPLIGTNPCT